MSINRSRGRLDLQFDGYKSIDTKASILVGFIAAAAQFVVTRPHRQPWQVLALALYAVALLLGLATIRLRTYMAVPRPSYLASVYEASVARGDLNTREVLLASLVATKVDAYDKNQKVEKPKTRLWWASLVVLVIAIGMSVVALEGAQDDDRSRHKHCRRDAHGAGFDAADSGPIGVRRDRAGARGSCS